MTPKRVPADGEAHVWTATLSAPAATCAYCAGLLSRDESARAERLRFERDRLRFVTGRGLLRLLLSAYLDADPRSLEFRYTRAGKPHLAWPSSPPLAFNLSHSGGRAVYAVTRGLQCGIDIEQVSDGIDRDGIALRFFAPGERDRLARLPAWSRRRAFFQAWTRKEALLKATGEGIAGGLDSVEIRALPGGRRVLVDHSGRPVDPADWSLADLTAGRGLVAAIAVRAPAVKIVRLTWRW